MQFCVLGSGSKGNATLVRSGESTVLIDNGFSGKQLIRRLEKAGRSLDEIDAILVTHEHSDHVAGVGVVSRRGRVPVYATEATFQAAEKKIGKPFQFNAFQGGEPFVVKGLCIQPFSVSHDAADPVGFVVSDGVYRMGYCTDTGCVTRLIERRLAGCHGLVLESNHDPKMLRNGPYPLDLQQRVRGKRGHLANREAAGLFASVFHDGLQAVVLAHLSEQNNMPALAFQEAARVAGGCRSCRVLLAFQNRVGRVIHLYKNGRSFSAVNR